QVDQAQVDDVDRDLGVVAGGEPAPGLGLDRLDGGRVGGVGLLGLAAGRVRIAGVGRVQAQRVGVGARDPVQVAAHHHGEIAPELLGNLRQAAAGQRGRRAPGNLGGLAVALQVDLLDVAVPVHRVASFDHFPVHSVFAVPAPTSALCSVC